MSDLAGGGEQVLNLRLDDDAEGHGSSSTAGTRAVFAGHGVLPSPPIDARKSYQNQAVAPEQSDRARKASRRPTAPPILENFSNMLHLSGSKASSQDTSHGEEDDDGDAKPRDLPADYIRRPSLAQVCRQYIGGSLASTTRSLPAEGGDGEPVPSESRALLEAGLKKRMLSSTGELGEKVRELAEQSPRGAALAAAPAAPGGELCGEVLEACDRAVEVPMPAAGRCLDAPPVPMAYQFSKGATMSRTLDVLPEEDDSAQWQVIQFVFSVALGISVGLTTVAFHWATTKVEFCHRHLAQTLRCVSWPSDPSCDAATVVSAEDASSSWRAPAAYAAVMTAGTLFAAVLVAASTRFFVPECAAGGSIATKICLAVGAPIPARIGLWRFILSALYVGLGNTLGVEAPTLHLSAAMASVMHQGAYVTLRRTASLCCEDARRAADKIFGDQGLPQTVVLGCAAGLAAAFGSPLAAVSYAVEEYVDVRQTGNITALVLFASLSATLVRWGCQTLIGSGPVSSAFGGSSGATDGIGGSGPLPSEEMMLCLLWLLAALVVGIVLGTLSPLLTKGVLLLRGLCQRTAGPLGSIFGGACGGLMAGLFGCAVYAATGCQNAWGLGALSADPDVLCSPAPSSADSRRLGDVPATGVAMVLWLGVGKLLSFGVCFATGGAGGVLMPSLVVGSLLGWCVGSGLAPLDDRLPTAGAVLGMAAFFGANMRLPLTSAGVVLEYAGNHADAYKFQWTCSIPLAAALGTWVAAWWDPVPVFEQMMLQDGIDPFTLNEQIQVMLHGSETPPSPPTGMLSRRSSVASSRHSASSFPGSAGPNSSTRIVMAAKRRSLVSEVRFQGPPPTQSSHSVISRPSSVPSGGLLDRFSTQEDLASLEPGSQRTPLASTYSRESNTFATPPAASGAGGGAAASIQISPAEPPSAVACGEADRAAGGNGNTLSGGAGGAAAARYGHVSGLTAGRGLKASSRLCPRPPEDGACEQGGLEQQAQPPTGNLFACRGSLASRRSFMRGSLLRRSAVTDDHARPSVLSLASGAASTMPRVLGRIHARQREAALKGNLASVQPSPAPDNHRQPSPTSEPEVASHSRARAPAQAGVPC